MAAGAGALTVVAGDMEIEGIDADFESAPELDPVLECCFRLSSMSFHPESFFLEFVGSSLSL